MHETQPLRSYGRIKARSLKPNQDRLLAALLPQLAVNLADPLADWGGHEIVVEIGFGGGEHLAHQALQHPNQRFLGVEPFINGVASCLQHLAAGGQANVRLHQGDARDVLAALPDHSVTRVDILFPDPWPKTRHKKRRLIQAPVRDALARVLQPGGAVHFATDWADYADWTLAQFVADPRFVWTAERADDWRKPWPGHVATRYELKRLGDCAPIYLRFARA
jgi:tRNA (guanine-N7-)-methyltransferase